MVVAVLFTSPGSLLTAAGLWALAVVVGVARRVWLGRLATALAVAGGTCWTLAAGTPAWDRPAVRSVAVMVDLSPSTRGATYRDRAALDRRLSQLLGDTPRQVFAFAGGPPLPMPGGATLPDVTCDRTAFAPPASADAVVLFSDGRFAPPAVAPPTFPVIDPSLEQPDDSAVQQLQWQGGEVSATVMSPGAGTLRWTGAEPATADVSGGGVVLARPTADEVTAAVAGHDRWPENDRLTIRAPPPATAERWWVGRPPPPAGFRAVSLPADPAAYLAAGAVVLDDVPADALSTEQQRLLLQYVRDLGGGLVIGGGPAAFAAGGYGSTQVDQLSPLASDPPTPAGRWVVLVDGSGSMAGVGGPGPTPWQVECDAVRRLVPALPAADGVRVGSFAAGMTWWSEMAPAGEARPVPPAGVGPGGPTNLAAAVRQVAGGADPGTLTHLLLMTDADADLPDLTADLRAHRIRLHVLATGEGSALPVLRRMATATGGSIVQQADPTGWVAAARQLARQAVPQRFTGRPTPVRWVDGTGPNEAVGWNRTWLKPTADLLAKGPDAPLAARWRVGTGQVVAVAFRSPDVLARLAATVVAEPRDPRFGVTWDAAADVRVSVDAVDGDRYLNGQTITLQVGIDGPTAAVPQVGPGEYTAAVPAPRSPAVATVRAGGRVIGRYALAGRYPPEFDAVGNDRPALETLARQTGGRVVEPTDVSPVAFGGPPRRTDLTPVVMTVGSVAIGWALVRWRRGRA